MHVVTQPRGQHEDACDAPFGNAGGPTLIRCAIGSRPAAAHQLANGCPIAVYLSLSPTSWMSDGDVPSPRTPFPHAHHLSEGSGCCSSCWMTDPTQVRLSRLLLPWAKRAFVCGLSQSRPHSAWRSPFEHGLRSTRNGTVACPHQILHQKHHCALETAWRI